MKFSFASTIKKSNKKTFPKDLKAGLIIAAVSIPISMGYAQIAGLPAVFGLYGSVFPIILFGLFSTSPQFIFGVDAAPAALVGSALLNLSVVSGSEEAIMIVPVITFWVAVWLLAFYFLKVGRLVSYISAPVMGGFITGICTEIILMQVPKLMGGSPAIGELPELLAHIFSSVKSIHVPSFVLGVLSLFILIISRRFFPKFPMAVLLMAAGALLTFFLPGTMNGIATLSAVEPGLPKWTFPSVAECTNGEIIIISLSIAAVITAETLLAEGSFALKNDYRISNNQEVLAFSVGNFSAAFTGCCPINGSVSRTSLNEQYQGKTQLTGVIAGLVMIAVLLFGTGFIKYLPVPMLTAIVISALMGATEFKLAHRLWKVNKKECFIFLGAFAGVLMFGTINGVIIGIILSFAEMIIRASKPLRCFLGIQPGHKHFRNISDGTQVYPVKGVVIFRFSNSLFFGNVDILQKELEDSIKNDTRAVILDAGGIGSLDITAADRLKAIYENLKRKHIRFYITEHVSGLNDQLRGFGLGYMIEEGAVRRTIHIALKDMGIDRPYPLEGNMENTVRTAGQKRLDNRIQEFAWAFGADTENAIEHQIRLQLENLKLSGNIEELIRGNWGYKEAIDEDNWLIHLEEHLNDVVQASGMDEKALYDLFEKSRNDIYLRLLKENKEQAE